MAKDQRTITIGVDIQPTLKNMDEVVSKLQKGLKEGSTQLDLSKGIGKSLQKQIENFQEQSRKFSQLTKDNQINLGDSKEAIKSGEKMIEIFKSLQSAIGDFNNLSVIDAKRLFPQAFNSQIDQARERLNSYAQDIQKLESAELNLNVRREELEASRNKLIELQGLLEERKTLNLSVDTAQKALEAANSEVDELRAKLRESISVKIKVAESDIAVLQDKATKAASARKEAGIDEKDFSGKGQTLAYKGHREETWRKAADSDEKTAALRAIEAYKQEMAIADQLIAKTKELSDLRKGLVNKDLAKAAEGTGASSEELTAITDALEKQKQAADQAGIAQKKLAAHSKEHGDIAPRIENATKTIQKQEKEVTDLAAEYDKLGKEINTNELIEILKKLGVEKISGLDITPELLKSEEGVKKLLSTLSTMDKVKLDMLKASLKGIGLSADQAEDAIKVMQQALRETDESAESVKEADKEVERLANNLKDFFSISNSIQLFKRAVTSAMNTVKELDATMTEAAVVTDFSVGDMWNKLPTYANEAQKLGVSINGLYGATTLYYQQGLKTKEAMALGIETMKMARIAGMESSEATEAMTAALRGFNMELNETSATQVNDVYSKLAAVTAADTNQIATAMSKTASIAASANMEFETTAALLAQIIETTQEAPETAGTALKTIIARFSEVKSLQNKGESSGKDAEGEDIDVNKIQTALRSVGISMNDFFAGTEGLDSVLMKLAEKWDTLDFTTQRYIATTAAGSRQQSRFIAMMSDYARTTELVSAAQNSAGASQMQFNKTLDSMDAKLQQLENAWNEFLMGLANSEILKAGVDVLTNLLSGINSIIDAMSFGAGPLKSIVSLLLTISTLKIGKGIFTGFTKSLEDTKALIRKNGNLSQAAIGNNSEVEGQKAGEKVGNGFFDKIIQVFRKRRPEVQAEIEQMLADETNKTTLPLTDDKTSESDPSAGSKNLAGQDSKQPAENLEKSAGAATKVGKAFEYVNKNSMVLATGFMSVAMACSSLSQRFEETGNTDLAKIFSGVATGASYLGTALMVLPGILQGLKVAADLASKGFVKLYASMGPIGLIIIGIVAAALILVAVIASLKTESEILSARLETISERMNHFAEESQKAKEAVNELTQALEDIKTKDPFEGLIKGTKAWNEALIENNKQVLELINKYPELRQYITNEDGVLGITEAGLNAVIDRQSRDAENAFYAAETLAQEKIKTERTLALNKTSFMTESEYRVGTMGISDVKYTELITELINQDIFNSKKVTDPEALIENVLSEAGVDDKDGIVVKTIYKDLFDVPNASDEQKLARQTSWENLVQENRVWTNSQQSSNQAIIGGIVGSAAGGTENFEELNNAMGALYANSFGWNFEYELEDVLQDFDFDNKRKEWDEKYAALKGINVSDIDKLKKDEGLTDEDIVRTVMIEERRKNIESSTKEMNNLLKDNKELAKWFNYENLNKEDIDQADSDYLRKMWSENRESLEAAGFTASSFKQYIDSQIGMAADALSETDETNIAVREASLKKDKKSLYSKTDIDQIEAATEAAVKNLNEERRKIFTTSMYDIDWSNKDEIVAFQKQMEDLGYNIPSAAMDELINKMIEVGNATREMSLDEVKETSKGVSKILSQLRSGKDKKTFSKEEYKAMIKSSPELLDNFVETLDGNYKLVDMTMQDLIKALGDNTKALVEQKVKELNAKSAAAAVMDKMGPRSFDRGQEKSAVENFINQMNEDNLQALGIEGLSKNLLDDEGKLRKDLEESEIMRIYNEINKIGTEGTASSYRQQANELQGTYDTYSAQSGAMTVFDIFSYGIEREEIPGEGGNVKSSSISAIGQVVQQTAQNTQDDPENQGKKAIEWTEKQENAIMELADSYEVAQHYKDAYYKAVENGEEPEILAAQSALKNAIYRADANKKLEKTISALKELNKEYGRVQKDGLEYEEAVQKYSQSLGINEDIIKGNFDLVQQAAAGSIEALQELYDMTNKNYGFTVNADGNFVPLEEDFSKLNEAAENYLKTQIELGNFKIVEVTAGVSGEFPVYRDGKMEIDYIQAGYTYTTLVYDKSRFEKVGMNTSSKSGGGGSSKKWKNPYDKFYNSVEKINEELRLREQLERRYQRLLDRNAATAAKLVQIQRNQLASLEAERKEREYALEGRKRRMKEILQKNSDVGQYATWNGQEMRIEIDWNLLEQLDGSTDKKLTTKVQNFISDLEKQQKLIEEELDAIESIEDATWEIYNSGKDEYIDLENQIKDAVINARQREIDELSEINNSINDTNSAILDSMQKQIDQERQLRNNQKTEEEIANKESKLAYLRQDTSGANALEIMKLEKEVNEQKQNYTDTLIDKKISELQEQNNLAAEQRERQIEIMQGQLDWYEKSQQVWNDVHTLMQTGLDLENNLIKGSDLETILKGENGFESMSQIEQMNWLNELESLVANGLKWLSNGAMQSLYGVGAEVNFVNADGQLITGKINSSGDVEAEGQIYSGKNFFMSTSGALTTTQTHEEASEAYKETITEPTPEPPTEPEEPSRTGWYFSKTGKRYSSRSEAEKAVNNWFNEEKVKLELIAAKNKTAVSLGDIGALEQTRDRALASIRIHQFKTGGLADFTGPAWLDGTKSRPEYILNADQTKAFFSLVDVLSSLQSGSSKTTQNSGDNTYDIDINVESIGSDYDVERLADTVKRLINEDARYRNNNAINLMR